VKILFIIKTDDGETIYNAGEWAGGPPDLRSLSVIYRTVVNHLNEPSRGG